MKNEIITELRTHESVRFNKSQFNMFYKNALNGSMVKYAQCTMTINEAETLVKVVSTESNETVYIPLVNIAYIKTEPVEVKKTVSSSKSKKAV